MDLKSKEKKLRYNGTCRCCLKKGSGYESIGNNSRKNYTNYLEIIKDTFNINIPNSGNKTLICQKCASLVQQANTFKTMLLHSQKLLTSVLEENRTEFVNVQEEPFEIKMEVCKDESETGDSIEDMATFTDGFSDNDSVERLDNKEDISLKVYVKKRELLKRFKKMPFKALPKLSILPKAKPLKSGITDKISHTLPEEITSHLSEKNAFIKNLTTILNCSNVVPFKGQYAHGYSCLFCRSVFKDPKLLREHFSEAHKNFDLKNILWKYGAECLVAYLDVTDLQCLKCNSSIPNLNDLKKHLTDSHKESFCTKYTDRMIPFKLSLNNIYECQSCGFNFETFGAIERHMNTHFRNYLCAQCGNGFVTKYRLKAHIKNMHTKEYHQCPDCSKVYATGQKLKNHIDTVHKLSKRFKCPHCPERFTEYFKRQKHLVKEHGAVPTEYKCNVCDKVFFKRYTLSRHLKKDHLEERDFNCAVCPYRCFTKVELELHMIRHIGERIFECNVCKKSYARKKTLKEHMRIHNDDRRFSCLICGQAFIQKCSLKCHMKTHSFRFNEQT